jgi:rSAM/selenodomain-associated transferase 1
MQAERSVAVLVFARAPEPGQAKTRLVPLLGAAGAARLQARLTEHALFTAQRANIGPIELWCAPDRRHPFFSDCAQRLALALRDQSGASLGARMRFAFDRALPNHDSALVIGTDAPVLTPGHLQAAAAALLRDECDALVHPAEDGGYVLLGLRRPCPEAFMDVDWGSERVFAQTMARLEAAGRRVQVRETLWDVDLPSDFVRLTRSLSGWDM